MKFGKLSMFLSLLLLFLCAQAHLFPEVANPHEKVMKHPYPHYAFHDFFNKSFINQLDRDFPKIPHDEINKMWNRSGINGKHYLYGSDLYNKFLSKSSAYRQLHDYVNSTAFVDWAMKLYRPFLEKGYLNGSCSVNPHKVHYEHYLEPLSNKVNTTVYQERKKGKNLPPGHDHNRLFSRMDLLHGFNGVYQMYKHQDLPHRVMGLLIYLDDLNKDAGGEFAMYHKWSMTKKIPVKRNLVVTHLTGWIEAQHSALLFHDTTHSKAMRRAVHIQLSAHQTVCR